MKKTDKINNKKFKIIIKDNIKTNKITLNGLEINNIPFNINKLKELEFLDLPNNYILDISCKIFKLKKLKILWIDRNIVEKNISVIKKLNKKIKIYGSQKEDLKTFISSF